jgi:peptidoglycan/xylan/chitin deacetylase (PgdA/CDA1 family)
MSPRQKISYGLKRTIAQVLYTLGVLRLLQAINLRHRTVVLMYHRVLTPEERRRAGSHPALVVDRDTFARHMALLRKRFVVLSVAELAEYIEQRRPLPSSSCLVTFDDGWRDNYDNALPIMAELRIPSLIFLPMNFIGERRVFWQEALVQLLGRAVALVRQDAGRRLSIERVLAPVGLDAVLDHGDPDPKPAIVAAVTAQKGLTRPAIERLVADLADAVGVRTEELAATDGFIDWPQVDAMTRQGVTFGGHGLDHLLLTQVSDAQADAEIHGSKAALDQRLREPTPTFSYPNGYWSPRLAEQVRRAGYRLAFSAMGGPMTSDDDPWTLRRVNIHESVTDTDALFLARLVGLFG